MIYGSNLKSWACVSLYVYMYGVMFAFLDWSIIYNEKLKATYKHNHGLLRITVILTLLAIPNHLSKNNLGNPRSCSHPRTHTHTHTYMPHIFTHIFGDIGLSGSCPWGVTSWWWSQTALTLAFKEVVLDICIFLGLGFSYSLWVLL